MVERKPLPQSVQDCMRSLLDGAPYDPVAHDRAIKELAAMRAFYDDAISGIDDCLKVLDMAGTIQRGKRFAEVIP